ncbi:MAG TPA: tripartite tricarboxylate transporter substrate binding protein [Reyranella sp.]|nr:tripartite tricarboxylate transporter substrate binding protein [Reyranella sp.]
MKRRSFLASTAALAIAPELARAEGYPDRPVHVVVPYAPGGSTDTGARLLGERLERILGQPFLVENKAGGGTIIGTEAVAKARPDGYTLLLATGALSSNAAFDMKLPYDTFRDLVPIVHFFDVPILVAASNGAPFKTMPELLAMARAQATPIPYASASGGSMQHLWAEYLKQQLDLHIEHVGYKGSSEVLRDVVAGQVPLMVDLLMPTATAVRAGKLRGLALAATRRSTLLPDVPVVSEVGLAGYEGTIPNGVMAPAGTPPSIVVSLNAAMNQVFADKDFAQRLAALGLTVTGGTPDAYGTLLRDETVKWRKVIREARIPPPL